MFASRRPFLVSAVVDHKLINKTVQRGNTTDETIMIHKPDRTRQKQNNIHLRIVKAARELPSSQRHSQPNKSKFRND